MRVGLGLRRRVAMAPTAFAACRGLGAGNGGLQVAPVRRLTVWTLLFASMAASVERHDANGVAELCRSAVVGVSPTDATRRSSRRSWTSVAKEYEELVEVQVRGTECVDP